MFVEAKFFHKAGEGSGGGGGSDPHNLGYYADLTALQTAHPTGTDGDFAILGSTDTIWVWDSGTSAWKDTDTKGQVTSVNGQTGDVTVQATLVSGTNIKSVNNNTLLGSGNLELSTYLTYPAGWTTNSTTKAFCDDIAADSSAVKGKAYLGEVTFSDLPASMVNGEIVVEIMDGTTAANKVIVLTLTSGNTAPYMWKYTYWNGGTDVSGWQTWATSAQGAKADTAVQPGDLATVATTGAYSDLTGTPTIPAAQVNSDWNASSGVAEILNKPTIPTVGDGTITITQGGVTKGTFTTNQSGNTTIDVDAGGSSLPSQTGNSGKFLTTDGTDPSWATISALQNTATGTDALTILGTATTKEEAINIGVGSQANVDSGVAIGKFALTTSYRGISIGRGAKAEGYSPIWTKKSSGCISIGFGASTGNPNNTEDQKNSIALGMNAKVTAANAMQINLTDTSSTNSDANTIKIANTNGNFEMMSADGTIPTDRYTTTPVADGTYVPTLTISSGVATRTWAAPSGGAPTTATATLAVNDWSSNTQTVNVTGVTANNTVFVAPAPASNADYVAGGIVCTAQASGTLTFTCTTTPTSAITVNVCIFG